MSVDCNILHDKVVLAIVSSDEMHTFCNLEESFGAWILDAQSLKSEDQHWQLEALSYWQMFTTWQA